MLHRISLLSVLGVMLLISAAAAADPPAATRPAREPIKQAEDGTILLHAKDVTIHGTTVRYEPKPEKNTIGYWTKKEDWVSWDFVVVKGGKFDVNILQGCGKGSGGAEVEFAVGEKKLKVVVEDTGGFQNFVSRAIGTIDLPAGAYTISVKPLTKPGVAVMDLRSVTLKPVEGK